MFCVIMPIFHNFFSIQNQIGTTTSRHIILTRRPAAEWLGDVIIDEEGNADVSWKVHSISPLVHMRFALLDQGSKLEVNILSQLSVKCLLWI